MSCPGPIVQRHAFLKTIRQSKSIPAPSNRALHLSDSPLSAFPLQELTVPPHTPPIDGIRSPEYFPLKKSPPPHTACRPPVLLDAGACTRFRSLCPSADADSETVFCQYLLQAVFLSPVPVNQSISAVFYQTSLLPWTADTPGYLRILRAFVRSVRLPGSVVHSVRRGILFWFSIFLFRYSSCFHRSIFSTRIAQAVCIPVCGRMLESRIGEPVAVAVREVERHPGTRPELAFVPEPRAVVLVMVPRREATRHPLAVFGCRDGPRPLR